jgi:carboxyl-terminal processing protease
MLGLACAIGVLIGTFFDFQLLPDFLPKDENKEKLARLIDYIEEDYVDEVNTDSLVNLAINNILKGLDPHSVYIPPEEYAFISQSMAGDFVGIGIRFYKIQDTIAVVETISGSPAEEEGIKAGDRILSAGGIQLYGKELPTDSLINIIKGPVGSKVELEVYRKSTDEFLDFKVKREVVPLKSVVASYLLCKNLSYIKIDRFAETTAEEFHESLKKLKEKGISKLVLDLRNNGGGYLEEAVEIADEFLPEGKAIVSVKDNDENMREIFATDDGIFEHGKLFVLINENSASASEIVAGALQDNDVGTIVGRRSFGKGLVQKEMQLGDGSVVRLTVARYYTPTGRSIQRPYNKGTEAYFSEYLHRFENGEFSYKDSIEVNDSLRFVTPGGKTVYGGGGIIPDVFVPKNLDYRREHLDYMRQAGLLDRFAFEQLDKNRNYYENLSREEFQQSDRINMETLEAFNNFLKDYQAMPSGFDENIFPFFKKYLKAAFAEQLFGSETFHKIINREDDMLEEVKEISGCG